jgi:hypothetical protein
MRVRIKSKSGHVIAPSTLTIWPAVLKDLLSHHRLDE